ncbi:MAG TPA: hypothetical protein VKB93_08190 [Thermoanaerobaculia bacterium]|nr:hypothetical protein [Thermoanaerobaculia bacterium]
MIGNLSHRITLILVVVCLAASVAADPYHPNIPKSQVVTLDAAAMERWANSGTPFALTFGKTTMDVVLHPAPVFPKEGVTFIQFAKDGSAKTTVVQGNFTYAGEILGEDPATTEVRLTIAGGVVEGYVLTKADWWFIEPLVRFEPKAASDQYLVYVSHETSVSVKLGDAADSMDEVFDWPIVDDKIPLATVADMEYFRQSDSNFQRVMLRHGTLINEVNGIYNMQFGREFRVPMVGLGSAEELEATHIIDLMGQFKAFMTPQRLQQMQSMIAHLTTGKDLDFDALGLGVQRGFHSLSKQSTTFDFRNTIVAARYIGRNFEATAAHAEVHQVCIGGQCDVFERTLDGEVFDEHVVARFSDGRLGADFNNVTRVCIIMHERGFPCREPQP